MKWATGPLLISALCGCVADPAPTTLVRTESPTVTRSLEPNRRYVFFGHCTSCSMFAALFRDRTAPPENLTLVLADVPQARPKGLPKGLSVIYDPDRRWMSEQDYASGPWRIRTDGRGRPVEVRRGIPTRWREFR